MRIAILGGGFTGLTAAYELQKKGHSVTLFEKSPALGGLAVGFRKPNWDWYLERAYHHLFANDQDIMSFARETEFDGITLYKPKTASLYDSQGKNFNIVPLDSPQDLLKFPYLPIHDRVRAGMVLGALKLLPPLSLFEQQTAREFLVRTMGNRAWKVLWQELFRKKFGKYAGNILASFIWARINKRTPKLAYIDGGFQTFIDHLEKRLGETGADIQKGVEVAGVERQGNGFRVRGEGYDTIISTLPSKLLPRVAGQVLPKTYLHRFDKLKYLHAVVLILETKQPLLRDVYWLNISTPKLPVMGVIQHTNLVSKQHYGGNHILYAANYVDGDSPLIKMSDQEVLDHYVPQLQAISPNFKAQMSNQIQNPKSKNKVRESIIENLISYYVFKGPFAQPIFDREFVQYKPEFETPVKNFYIANLDMTYPYDRGTNFAVRLGRQVARMI